MENLVEIDGMKINKVSNELWEVYSEDKKYVVVKDVDGEYACTCHGYWYNGRCKHIEAVKKFEIKYG